MESKEIPFFDDNDQIEFPFLRELSKFQSHIFPWFLHKQFDKPIIQVTGEDGNILDSDLGTRDSQEMFSINSDTLKSRQNYNLKPGVVNLRQYNLFDSTYHIELVQLPSPSYQTQSGITLQKVLSIFSLNKSIIFL